MHTQSMAVLLAFATVIATPIAWAQAPARPVTENGPGFFAPSADPALTSIQPPAVPAATPPASRSQQAVPAAVERSEEQRRADEAAMDRVENLHSRIRVESPPRAAPVITSPLDGTAPIMSPLDATAPIVSPLGR